LLNSERNSKCTNTYFVHYNQQESGILEKEIFEIAIKKIKQKIKNNNEILFIDDKEKNFRLVL